MIRQVDLSKSQFALVMSGLFFAFIGVSSYANSPLVDLGSFTWKSLWLLRYGPMTICSIVGSMLSVAVAVRQEDWAENWSDITASWASFATTVVVPLNCIEVFGFYSSKTIQQRLLDKRKPNPSNGVKIWKVVRTSTAGAIPLGFIFMFFALIPRAYKLVQEDPSKRPFVVLGLVCAQVIIDAGLRSTFIYLLPRIPRNTKDPGTMLHRTEKTKGKRANDIGSRETRQSVKRREQMITAYPFF